MRAIETKDIKPVLEACFATDPALLSKWHIAAGSGLEACVDRTLGDLANTDPSFKFYKLVDGEKLVGFFGAECGHTLTTIFVAPDYRNRSDMGAIWKLIRSHFQSDFYAAVYSHNEPAVRFYSRNASAVRTFQHGEHTASGFHFAASPQGVI